MLDVVKPTKDTKIDKEGVFYVLPLTKLIVEVEISKIIQTKGPYSDYTEKYLGELSNVIRKNNVEWEINNISFHTVAVPDSDNIYFISQTSQNTILPFKLTKEGFLVSYNCNEEYTSKNYEFFKHPTNNNSIQNFSFDIIPTDKAYKIEYDTLYKIQTIDTIIRKVPILKPNIVQKTTEEQAKELADKITTLSDDRAALLVGEGDNDYLPEGRALSIMLKEIDELMESYLKMFKGQTDTIHYRYYFTYTPTKENLNSQISLFKFSRSSGILKLENKDGQDVVLKILPLTSLKKMEDFASVRNFYFTTDRPQKKGLFYRIPQKVKFQIDYNNQVLAEKSIFIPQMGIVTFLPAKIFKNSDLKIKFYPELGSIKQIFY